MLSEMTATQYQELMLYFETEGNRKIDVQAKIEEITLLEAMNKAVADQGT